MSNSNDFIIENGVLTKYTGSGGDVVIPDGVTKIADWAFLNRREIESVAFPAGLKEVGANTFLDCKKLVEIALREGVESVGLKAFAGCDSLLRVTLPASLKRIGVRAFDSPKIEKLELNGLLIGRDWFGASLPAPLAAQVAALAPHMDDPAFKQYALNTSVWNGLDYSVRAAFILSRQSKSVRAALLDLIPKSDADKIGGEIAAVSALSKKESASAEWFVSAFASSMSEDVAAAIMAKANPGAQAAAVKPIPAAELPRYSPAGEELLSQPVRAGKSGKEFIRFCLDQVKSSYALSPGELPKVNCADGTPAEPFVVAWMLFCHESFGSYDFKPSYSAPGLRPEAKAVAAKLDYASFQKAVADFVFKYLATPYLTKKTLLVYPACRYLDDKGILILEKKLTSRTPEYKQDSYQPLLAFRKAVLYSETVAALGICEESGDIKTYSDIRKVDVGTARDGVVKLLHAAKGDPKEEKRLYDMIYSIRVRLLKKQFLTGNTRAAVEWRKSYLDEPVFRNAARNVVWSQGENTFIITANGLENSAGEPYALAKEPVAVAHPMEMKREDVLEWRARFGREGAVQPFRQMDEPVVDLDSVKEDRYADCDIPLELFFRGEEDGVRVTYGNDRGTWVRITLADCRSRVGRAEYDPDAFPSTVCDDDPYRIRSIRIARKSRKSNRVIVYFDGITIKDRVINDEMTAPEFFASLTEAELKSFIELAAEHEAVKTTAALLDYLHKAFPKDGSGGEWKL